MLRQPACHELRRPGLLDPKRQFLQRLPTPLHSTSKRPTRHTSTVCRFSVAAWSAEPSL